jgi:hypothetical protein
VRWRNGIITFAGSRKKKVPVLLSPLRPKGG